MLPGESWPYKMHFTKCLLHTIFFWRKKHENHCLRSRILCVQCTELLCLTVEQICAINICIINTQIVQIFSKWNTSSSLFSTIRHHIGSDCANLTAVKNIFLVIVYVPHTVSERNAINICIINTQIVRIFSKWNTSSSLFSTIRHRHIGSECANLTAVKEMLFLQNNFFYCFCALYGVFVSYWVCSQPYIDCLCCTVFVAILLVYLQQVTT